MKFRISPDSACPQGSDHSEAIKMTVLKMKSKSVMREFVRFGVNILFFACVWRCSVFIISVLQIYNAVLQVTCAMVQIKTQSSLMHPHTELASHE